MIGTLPGQWINQTGPIPAANASTGVSAIAGLSVQGGAVLAAPIVSKGFSPQIVSVGPSVALAPAGLNPQQYAGSFVSHGRLEGVVRYVSYRTLPDYPLVVAVGTSTSSALRNAADHYIDLQQILPKIKM